MMKSKITVSLLLFLTGLAGLKAQVNYNLSQCIKSGLENNYSIIIAGKKESVSDNNFTPGNAGYLPSIDFTSRYSEIGRAHV